VLATGGVVHQDIDSPRASPGGFHDSCHLIVPGQIAQGDDCLAAITADFGRHPFCGITAATIDNDGGPLLSKAPGNGFATTASTARHGNTFVLQFQIHCGSPLSLNG